MDTVSIALISVIACVVLFAFYFQFKFVGIDARTRDAEKVATKFTNVLEATTVGEDIKKNYQAVQTRLSDLQEENDFNTEDVSLHSEEIEYLKKENRLMREYYGKLVETVKGLPVEGATVPDLTIPEVPRSRERERGRSRYDSDDDVDEDDYPPVRGSRARNTGRRASYSQHGREREEEPVPPHRGDRGERGRNTRSRVTNSSSQAQNSREREGRRRGRDEEEHRGGRAYPPVGGRREREREREPAYRKERRVRYDDGYDSEDFM